MICPNCYESNSRSTDTFDRGSLEEIFFCPDCEHTAPFAEFISEEEKAFVRATAIDRGLGPFVPANGKRALCQEMERHNLIEQIPVAISTAYAYLLGDNGAFQYKLTTEALKLTDLPVDPTAEELYAMLEESANNGQGPVAYISNGIPVTFRRPDLETIHRVNAMWDKRTLEEIAIPPHWEGDGWCTGGW